MSRSAGSTSAIFSQGAGIHVTGAGATGDWIYGDFLGTDPTGTQAEPDNVGVEIDGGAVKNVIGTNGDGVNDDAERNLLSGNSYSGVWITGQGTTGNIVAGDLIGTTNSGDTDLPNGTRAPYDYSYASSFYDQFGGGVIIDGGAYGNQIGAGGSGIGDIGGVNVISGNADSGIEISGSGTTGNVIDGNVIGTDPTGIMDLGNGHDGIEVDSGASENTIGGTAAVAGDLIADNGGVGVAVIGSDSVGDGIVGDRIFDNGGQAIDLNDDGVTADAPAPRHGPNDLQNFPIILAGASGQLQGWLGGSLPETTYRIDVYASAGYGPGDSGAAQDDLGSLDVTTDATGQVSFAVPFTAPVGLPIIAATATDPQGDTSEVSSSLPGGFQAQSAVIRLAPGTGSLAFSPGLADGIDLQDPGAGSPGPTWDLSMSVTTGALTLGSTAGLAGSGDGTGSLFYSGPLAALDDALDGMTYAPPSGFQGNASLDVAAHPDGITLIAGQVIITDGSFVVTTTADSGPGTLRHAILDANAATGGTDTIDFDIPARGVESIALAAPLPPITGPLLIDGTSQPGYAGIPLIALLGRMQARSMARRSPARMSRCAG